MKRKEPWYTREYVHIETVNVEGELLRVKFGDGSEVNVPTRDVVRLSARGIRWDDLTIEADCIVVPSDGDPVEIPWDVIRLHTDPAFQAHMDRMAALNARAEKARA